MPCDWHLAFVLPNLQNSLTVDDLSGYLALASHQDPRVCAIAQNQPGARKFLNGFKDGYGTLQKPSAIIWRIDIPCPKDLLRRAWVDFRNIVALAAVLPGWAQVRVGSAYGAPNNPLWGDAFAVYPGTLDATGAIHSINLAQMILSHPSAPFSAMPNPRVPPYRAAFGFDLPLLAHLLRRWKERYGVSGVRGSKHEALFRSLEMAYRATLLPDWNEGSLYDFGTTLGLWISALEILAHPRKGNVTRQHVMELLGQAHWISPRLARRVYRYKTGNTWRTGLTLTQRLCHEVYEARNAFLHGNRITQRHWRLRSSSVATPLRNLVPSIYRTALMAYLGWDVSPSLARRMTGKIRDMRPGVPGELELDELTITWCHNLYENHFLSLL